MADIKGVPSKSNDAPGARRQATGIGLIVLSTVSIAIVPSLAKFAYDGGSNTLSVITGRSILSLIITLLLIFAFDKPLRIARRPMVIALAMGLAYAVMLYGYLGAVNYLAVNLVILIYFIHPLLVGFMVILMGQERLTVISVGALVAALVGLGLAIGFSLGNPSPAGIGLATMAMVMTALVVVGNARAVREAPALSVGFYMMLSAAATLGALFVFVGTLALPATALGWTGFIGVAVASTVGTLAFLGGMAAVGATRAAMISNLEPVLGVLFAIVALGERVTLVQTVGIGIVLGAIFVMEWRR
jgi:drug/metabolite transporter (DMT)-like permease